MSSWDNVGELATVAQLTGLDAVKLIGLIAKAANTARMHKRNCRQFAQHLKLIGNLLEQLKISELKKYPETREPLEQLEDALRRSYILVNSCQDRSYLYLLAMGWNIVYQFRKAQNEIDRYLRLVPLITLVDNARVRERLEVIEMDQREYTLDEEDRRVQDVILKPDPSSNDAMVLKKTLSCSYPNLPFCEALQKENEKLQFELQRSQAHLDVSQCEVIQRLLEVTEAAAANVLPEKSVPEKGHRKLERGYSDANSDKEHSSDEGYHKKSDTRTTSRKTSSVSSGHDLLSTRGSHRHEEWHTDLLGCCSEPCLCIKTCLFPCGTFSKIATVATDRHMSSAEACNELMAYSLVLSCCCYTCNVRRKLRKTLNITGGFIDDFLSHLMCCCCALVQEWREVEIRGVYGPEKTKTSPPTSQYMES
ncbi:protein MID1-COMPLEMENTING ACTIVITY 1 [Alnus glutinosa]|uniref:protein MID1-COMPLEMENTING ACTIVITY 1 n=1 Tax=Alnus glutinosa TaxID=3517 RepID=UPI002D782503|nr:protein MID1-COMPLEMENTING ACTIVITY 1 [Alnus glutinosa]XP_062144007.1 protein MID1-COMPLEMENTING ACTIVITY 1 [Alnus glutinosa]XP_062144008.1 protein MID1-COMPLEMENTING ACTIVITY 1 [Alnus glutinosa]XP_062144010.1 protein MID1-COMPLEMENTING ACTIVITY 1 [Alnus glutinosa]XP_062144011.1 protein MID1-COMPLEMENTING ACTIVITY 1 [Alnus glutinosa]XP_062144012.1 protein MID1-COMPLEMENTING ACTIVITY 1 [Alnus glutinosa]